MIILPRDLDCNLRSSVLISRTGLGFDESEESIPDLLSKLWLEFYRTSFICPREPAKDETVVLLV